jgi:hypothetical protein
MNIEELKAEVAAKVAANILRVTEAAEVARLKATLTLESSEALFNARVRLEASGQETAKLQQLVDECAAIVSTVPIHNAKTRANRVWAATHKYNYGAQVDLMYQLATGILYSCQEHKQLLLAHTGIDLAVVEQTVAAFGNPTYYSRNHNVVVDAKAYDVTLVQETLQIMQSQLGAIVDTSSVKVDTFRDEFERAVATAKSNYDMAAEAIAEADFTV